MLDRHSSGELAKPVEMPCLCGSTRQARWKHTSDMLDRHAQYCSRWTGRHTSGVLERHTSLTSSTLEAHLRHVGQACTVLLLRPLLGCAHHRFARLHGVTVQLHVNVGAEGHGEEGPGSVPVAHGEHVADGVAAGSFLRNVRPLEAPGAAPLAGLRAPSGSVHMLSALPNLDALAPLKFGKH